MLPPTKETVNKTFDLQYQWPRDCLSWDLTVIPRKQNYSYPVRETKVCFFSTKNKKRKVHRVRPSLLDTTVKACILFEGKPTRWRQTHIWIDRVCKLQMLGVWSQWLHCWHQKMSRFQKPCCSKVGEILSRTSLPVPFYVRHLSPRFSFSEGCTEQSEASNQAGVSILGTNPCRRGCEG